jgi:hypothetical protein
MNTRTFHFNLIMLIMLTAFVSNASGQVLHSVYFETGASQADSDNVEELENWLRSYLPLRQSTIELKAYCDERSSDAFNRNLSAARGEFVATVLRSMGYENIVITPLGRQTCEDKTEACMKLQRRVDLVQQSPLVGFDFNRMFNQKPFQYFLISSTENNIIKGAEGTQIHLQKNCFDMDSKSKSDSVEIFLREYHKTGEMFLAGLTTAAGDQMIESGGTIEIYAIDKKTGRELTLLEPMGIIFPNREENDRMQTFLSYSQRDLQFNFVSWEQPEWIQDFLFRDMSFYEDKHARDRAETIARETVEMYPSVKTISGPSMIDDMDQLSTGKSTFNATFEGNDYALVANKKVIYKYVSPTAKSPFEATVLSVENNNAFDSKKPKVKASSQPSGRNDFYITSNRLGLINCDRWLNSNLPLASVPLVKAEGINYYALIFSDIKSVMPAYMRTNGIVFPNIPIGQKATVVGLSYDNDNFFFGSKEIICDGSSIDLELQPSTKLEIERFFAGI